MKFLLNSPLAMSMAERIWGSDDAQSRDVSPQACVESLPFFTLPCLTVLAAKSLGVAIIVGAFLNKVPIIRNVLQQESVAGLARGSLYADCFVCANAAFYGLLEGHPLTAFGESFALTGQAMILSSLSWRYQDSPKVSPREKVMTVAAAVAYLVIVTLVLDGQHRYLLQSSIWPIYIYSRGSLIYEAYRLQHTGANSAVTVAMNIAGSGIRLFTVLVEVGWDWSVLTSYALGVMLNGVCMMQIYLYRENTEKFLLQQAKKKKE